MKKIFYIASAIVFFTMNSCSTKNEQSEETPPPEVKTASVDTSNIFIAQVCKDGKWGYMGTDFKFIIEPQFDGAMGFSEGLACVKTNGKWGFINIKGEFVIPASFDGPGDFHEGLAKVSNLKSSGADISRYQYINTKGKNVFDKLFKYAEDFNNGTATVREDGPKYFIDKSGNKVAQLNQVTYNHFKHTKRPFGGQLSKSLQLDKKTGQPVDVKYDRGQMGYTDDLGYPATEAIYCATTEFKYAYQTPKMYFSNNPNDTIKMGSALTEVIGSYVRTENVEEGDYAGIKITFKTDAGEEITFDGYNANSKLIPLYFICSDCPSPDFTKKSSIGMKHLLKYSVQKTEDGGGMRESKILEAIDVAK